MTRPWWLLLLAAALRALVCAITEVPGRDGASYLWMAENAAAGRVEALFATVFHPLYPALVAVLLALVPGLDVVLAGQIVAAGAGALAVLPLWHLARAIAGERAATWAGIGYATIAWFSRHPAECLSEGVFHLAVTTAVWCAVRAPARPLGAGVAAAAAWLTRPEGAVLVVLLPAWMAWRGARGHALRSLAVAVPLALLLPLGLWSCGHGWTLTPKAGFNFARGIGSAEAPASYWLEQLARVPGHAFEELGWLWLPVIAVGTWRLRPRAWQDGTVLLVVPFLVQCLVAPLLFSHPRFLSGYGALLMPFGGAGVLAVGAWLRQSGAVLPAIGLVLLLGSEVRIAAVRNADRAIERELGRWLRPQLAPGEFVVSDMPRLCFFAGTQPPPPRPLAAEELLTAAADPRCRFVAVVLGRTPLEIDHLHTLGLEPMELPALLSATAGRDRVSLFERSRNR